MKKINMLGVIITFGFLLFSDAVFAWSRLDCKLQTKSGTVKVMILCEANKIARIRTTVPKDSFSDCTVARLCKMTCKQGQGCGASKVCKSPWMCREDGKGLYKKIK